jgi:predicted flavoprotein YhiN
LLHVDLRPDLTQTELAARVDGARQGRSLPNFLRHAAQLSPAAIGLVQEALHAGPAPDRLSTLIKAVPLTVTALQPIERAISSAGGIARDELDAQLMLRRLPGVFAAGEMLDWEAPTGGYLLQACFATGVLASNGIAACLAAKTRRTGSD